MITYDPTSRLARTYYAPPRTAEGRAMAKRIDFLVASLREARDTINPERLAYARPRVDAWRAELEDLEARLRRGAA